MKTIFLPDKVNTIIHALQMAGHEAYAVGGCVRDSLLGRSPEDWDITTSAKPEEVKSLFSHTVDTGIAHGTVTVMLDHEGFEVTTYRIDGEYEDARHPKQVEFTPLLSLDLERRDFTINAMAYNDKEGVIDLFGGIKDMQNGVIRCVGDANERFDEDALRIMRAVRFSAQLDFTIAPDTLAAIASHAEKLSHISAERIRVELTKLLLSDHPERLLTAQETGLTAVFLPEFDQMLVTTQENPHHIYDVGMHTIHALSYIAARTNTAKTGANINPQQTTTQTGTGDNTQQAADSLLAMPSQKEGQSNPQTANPTLPSLADANRALASLTKKEQTVLRYAILLHDCAKPETKFIDCDGMAHFYGHDYHGADLTEKILLRLKFDNDTIRAVSHLVGVHDTRYAESGKSVKARTVRHAISRIGVEYLPLLFLLQEADLNAQSPALLPDKLRQLDEARRMADRILAEKQCVCLKDLAVNGSDLIAAGIKPGKEIGRVLAGLLDYVIEYPEKNNREDLLVQADLIFHNPPPPPLPEPNPIQYM